MQTSERTTVMRTIIVVMQRVNQLRETKKCGNFGIAILGKVMLSLVRQRKEHHQGGAIVVPIERNEEA